MSAKDYPLPTPTKDKDLKDPPIKDKSIITIDTDGPSITPLLSDPQHLWWDTYHAALTGLWSNPYLSPNGPAYLHLQATAAADVAHGVYPADPPPEP